MAVQITNSYSNGQITVPVSDRFLKQTIESPPNGLYVYDLENQSTVFINQQFSKMTGYDWNDVNHMNQSKVLELVQAQHRDQFLTHWDRLRQANDSLEIEIEYRMRTKAGSWIWVISRDSVFERTPDGQVSKYFGVLIDLTEKRELEQKLRDQNRILETAAMIVETDPQGVITSVSDKFCEISKYSRSELLGQTHQMLKSGHHDQKFFATLWTEISSGRTWRGEIKNRAKDGTYFWVDTTIMPFFDWEGRISKYVAARREITKEKDLQQDLRSQIEIAQVALNSSNLKSGFISEMSHEVRNNLNLITGYSDLLSDEGNPENKEFINQIKKASDHTIRIMKDVLDALRLENKRPVLNLSAVNLRELITEMIDLLRIVVEKKKLTVGFELLGDLPSIIYCDRYRLSQIFLNLLTNATKFTDQGGIRIRVEKIEQLEMTRPSLLFSVADTGRGIPPHKLKDLFKSFEQCSPTDSNFGSGLGLSICKKLVQLMDGEIWADSDEKGSIFYFLLPLRETL